MKSANVIAPMALAVLLVAGLLAVLFFRLEQARALLLEHLPLTDASPAADPRAETVLQGDSYEYAALASMREGDLAARRNNWATAEAAYDAAVKAEGGLPALRKLAHAQLQRRRYQETRSTLDRLRRNGARSEDLLLIESGIELRSGELVRARQLLESADDSPQKHYGLALLAIAGRDHAQAREELKQVMAGWDPVLRSQADILMGAYEEYTLFPDSPDIHLLTLLSRALAQAQECELALPILSQVTQAQDDYRDAWIVQGYCELGTERFAQALASFEHAYAIDPEKPEIQYFLARTYAAQEDHGNALRFLQYALENGFEPETEVRRALAREALETGNAAVALEQYDALSTREQATMEDFADFVTAAMTAGRTEEALVKAGKATEKWPDNPDAYTLYAWAAEEADRDEEARNALEKALSIDPGHAEASQRLERMGEEE